MERAPHPRPRLRPKLSGRASSNLTEAFMPPSPVASLYVPESWNTSLSTAGAFVLTMFASNATLRAARASGVSTVDVDAAAASAASTLDVIAARVPVVVVANRPAAYISTSRRRLVGNVSEAESEDDEDDARVATRVARWCDDDDDRLFIDDP